MSVYARKNAECIWFIVAQKRAETNYSKTVTRSDMVWDPYLENRFRKK
jgi:hypothetical protein